MARTKCPNCGWKGEVERELVGEELLCPECEEQFTCRALKKKKTSAIGSGGNARGQSSRSQKSHNEVPGTSESKRTVALLLCFFLGGLSVHRFYVGKAGTAILQIFTFGGLGIWLLIDFIMIICGNFTDKKGAALTEW